jgi:hypothetical protein
MVLPKPSTMKIAGTKDDPRNPIMKKHRNCNQTKLAAKTIDFKDLICMNLL